MFKKHVRRKVIHLTRACWAALPLQDIPLPPPLESAERTLDRVRGAELKTTHNVHGSKNVPTIQKKRLGHGLDPTGH